MSHRVKNTNTPTAQMNHESHIDQPKMEPIAIIGAGCRFPGGASTPSKLWDLLAAPRDLTGRPPKNRFNGDAFFHADGTHHGATNAINSYYLEEDVSHFDTAFFNIQPAEAESMDPQQRLLLEVVYDSLCAAGQRVEVLRGSDTAVYVGLMCDDYNTMLRRDWETMPRYTSTGLCRAIHSNRISYFFGWHGASATIDTACSGSMVALDQAIQTLRNGRSKMAVAAGANLLLTPDMSISESKLGMLSTDGHCNMWDASGNGYARGEGVACVVIKTLSQALKDNDTIECIIRETAVNQDGRTPGLTMPSGAAQAELIRSCYERAGLDPLRWPQDRPQFFHAHGTGTQAGDPQESSAIAKALFTEDYEGEKLAVGSIKTIIGHTEGTAGIASVIGTMLALKNGVIPQNLHFHNLNPSVVPYYRNLEVPTSARPWKIRAGEVRRASVNSFGFGGTNAHAIMEEYIPIASSTELGTSAGLNLQFTPLVFSASTDKSLKEMLSKQLDFMKSHPNTNLGDVAYTLQHRRSVLSNCKSIMASTAEAAIEALETIVASGPGNDNSKAAIADYQDIQGSRFAGSWPKILGIFTGQGAQWARMGAALIEASPFAQSRLSELDGYLQSVPNPEDRPTWTLREQLLAPKNVSRISEAALSQPLCTAVQVILVDVLKAAGISFAAVIGHSSGEIGTAYAAGLVTASEAIRIAYFRGLYAKLSGNPTRVDSDSASPQSRGAMMAVGASYEEARDFCSREIFTDRIIQIAAVNSDSSITLSGDEKAIDEAESLLKAEGKFARKLKVDTAYHSAFMTPCAGPYLSSLDECGVGAGAEDQEGVNTQTRWFSSVLEGEEMTSDKLTNQYWLDNMCNPVLFAGALSEAIKQIGQFDLAIEVGPHPALKGPALATITVSSPNIPYTGLLSRDQDDVTQLGDALGFIWARLGADSVNFSAVESLPQTGSVAGIHKNKVVSDLPSYPFDHGRSYWISNRLPNQYQQRTPPNPILGVACFEAATSGEKQWRNILDPREIPWLKGHKLQGQPVFPAAGYVCMAIEAMNILASEAAAATHGQANEVSLIQLTDVELPHAIAFDDDDDKSQGVEVIFSLSSIVITDSDITAKWACYTATSGSDGKSVLNAKGAASCRLSPVSPCELPSRESETDKESRDNLVDVAVDKFYNFLSRKGYGYSAPFAGVSSIKHRLEYSSGKLLDQSESTWEDQLVIHPGLLDSALQTLFAAWVSPGDSRLWALHIPLSFSAITINPYFFTAAEKRTEMSYETYLTSETPTQVAGDIYLFHRDGELGSNNTAVRFEGAVLAPFSPASILALFKKPLK
ncbi:ketoacyl-synt-domain-containing protein [Xylaria venustula]|nr:ketoacyl-synt-domain-containing protein [Xylaria venustula]